MNHNARAKLIEKCLVSIVVVLPLWSCRYLSGGKLEFDSTKHVHFSCFRFMFFLAIRYHFKMFSLSLFFIHSVQLEMWCMVLACCSLLFTTDWIYRLYVAM